MSLALRELERLYTNQDLDVDKKIRAINSLSVLSNSYVKLHEAADFEDRLRLLEEKAKLR